ncbi:MAG: hypothetical protein IPH44_09190 [Myxococcales bacterium]|nr:hypothetical protein [Myxococcales bacterium]MBK7198721.1 hypothetical protein [Myxococcales bacterium]MBP6845508.1 hypothetical protein [Kofleriaceae bacterium]
MANSRAHAASIGAVLIAGTLVFTAGGCNNNQLEGAKAEVQQGAIKVTVPAVPAFEVPKPNADGSHTIKELRVQGQKYLKQEISVSGVVVWAYDCATAIRQPSEDDAAVKKRIEDDPTLCRRPAFYLGDAADTPVERAAWIVEVPRLPTAAEKKNLPKEAIEVWPAVPPYKVGDQVVVTGTWTTSSPHGENNTDGLLVYKQMKNVTQNWETPPLDPNALPAATIAPPAH